MMSTWPLEVNGKNMLNGRLRFSSDSTPSPNPPDEQKLEPIPEAKSQPPAEENNKKEGYTTNTYHN